MPYQIVKKTRKEKIHDLIEDIAIIMIVGGLSLLYTTALVYICMKLGGII